MKKYVIIIYEDNNMGNPKFKKVIVKKKVPIMNEKLKELNKISAEQLLEKVNQSDVIPVDIAQICYDLGIRVRAFDFSSIEKKLHKQTGKDRMILGTVLVKDNNLAILYRYNDTVNRKRFTLAHELAHCCLHIDSQKKVHIEFRIDDTNLDKKEIEANTFAGELLIPERSLRNIIGNTQCVSLKDFKLLTKMFMVSENVMKARFDKLKISLILG